MRSVAIVGVGLIGGSFALALRRAGFTGPIYGVSSPATLEKAVALGVVDCGLPLEAAVPQADLIYLAQPIQRILQQLPEIGRLARPDALITDAGSTKREIVDCGRRSCAGALFLGGHPMAGKESRGVESAEAGLFEGRTYVVTPAATVDLENEIASQFLNWINRIGARLVVCEAAEHDRLVALTSHLPQLLSTVLASALARTQLSKDSLVNISGPGLLDQTRLALSPYDVWGDIFSTNTAPIDAALGVYIEELTRVRALLAFPEMAEVFTIAGNFSKELRKDRN
jgi:prephenate dehydrogenase